MAVLALMTEYVEINSTSSLNGYVVKASLTLDVVDLDSTAMGDTWKESTPGVKSGTFEVEFNDSFTAGEVNSALWLLFGTVVPFKIRPLDTGVSATNPSYFGNVLVTGHNVGGAHGELAKATYSWPVSGTVTRSTTQ